MSNEAGARHSIFELTHRRAGERLVQGILLFALQTDPQFRRDFTRWLGWGECSDVREEVREGIHRHDLLFHYPDGPRTVELKVWADWTKAQTRDPSRIDAVIVPEGRRQETLGFFSADRVRTWKELMQRGSVWSPCTRELLSGLQEYTWASDYVVIDFLKHVIEKWKRQQPGGPTYVDFFLNRCRDEAKEFGLRSRGSSTRHRWWGKYLARSRNSPKQERLWFGFIFDFTVDSRVKNLAFVLQVCGEALADELGIDDTLPDWSPWSGCKRGFQIAASDGEGYSVGGWKQEAAPWLKKYAGMRQ